MHQDKGLKTEIKGRPLEGRTFLSTRPEEPDDLLTQRLRQWGARVYPCPMIRIECPEPNEPLEQALSETPPFDWLLLTSVRAVEAIRRCLRRHQEQDQVTARRIAAVGSRTAAALYALNRKADLVPRRSTTRALLEALRRRADLNGRRLLLLQPDIAPPLLEKGLLREGAEVTRIAPYRTLPRPELSGEIRALLQRQALDGVMLTSASAARTFSEALERHDLTSARRRTNCFSIGPATTAAARKAGLHVVAEASAHTLEGLQTTLLNFLTCRI
jgi:uroporphyrinogen-III synthase